jgi:thymidylate kinase
MDLDVDSVPAVSRPFLITFSGIDGAGKTTQIDRLTAHLETAGLRVLRLSFWEHVAVWPNLRAGVGHRSLNRKNARTLDLSFAPKNNKHIRKWYLTAARSGFYLLDIGRLQTLLSRHSVWQHDVVIFDRYVYDQIANLYSHSLAARSYSRLLLKLAPVPDLAFVVDAVPAEAFARKPEYPLEFVHRNRRSFLQLREIHPSLLVIPPAGPDEVTQEIRTHVDRSRLLVGHSRTEKTEHPAPIAVLRAQTFPTVQDEPTAKI